MRIALLDLHSKLKNKTQCLGESGKSNELFGRLRDLEIGETNSSILGR